MQEKEKFIVRVTQFAIASEMQMPITEREKKKKEKQTGCEK